MEAAAKLIAYVDEVSDKASNEAIQPNTPPGVSACSTAGAASAQQSSHSSGGCGCGH